MESDLLLLASQGLFALLFVLALRNFLRHRDLPHFEVLAFFSVLALGLAPAILDDALNIELPAADVVAVMILVTQPLVFLRLVGHFRPLPRYQQVFAHAAVLASWAIMLYYRDDVPTALALVVVGLFVYVEAYATYLLVVVARDALGSARSRARAIIAGSACLGLVFLLLGISAAAPSVDDLATALIVNLVMASALAYYLGFAPPRRLQRVIQQAEVARAYDVVSAKIINTPSESMLDDVGTICARTVGGKLGLVALGQPGSDRLRLHIDPAIAAYPALVEDPIIDLSDPARPLARVWNQRSPQVISPRESSASQLARIVNAVGGARSALVAPLLANDEPIGLVIILLDRRTAFLDDDCEVLAMLAERVGAGIQNRRLFEAARHDAANRQLLLELSNALANELEAAKVAEELAARVADLIPSSSWGVLLPAADGGLEIVATGGERAEDRRHRRIAPGAGITGRALQTGEPVLVDDVRDDPNYFGIRPEVRSELAVPLRSHGVSVGVLNFERTEVAAFTPSEVALAQIVANTAAQALARARLIDQLQQQNRELDAANRHKSEFLAAMSHELRTPLNSIIGFSELLLDDPDEDFAPTSRQFLETIHRSGRHLLALINDILDLSKVEAGHMELVLDECLLAELVTQALSTLKPLADQNAVELRMDVPTDITLVADSGKLKQILYNLLSNAIKFTPDGGTVSVLAVRREQAIQLTVADTGIGIASEHQERIFQEFQQVDRGPGRHFEGTGLGLALTRRFVELHGGSIRVESEPGKGSRFHVLLPARELPAAAIDELESGAGLALDAVPHGEDGPGGPLVLVVEDDARAANLMTLYLKRGGYSTVLATTGEQALEEARERQPAAITLDILLPTLDGWEVLRSLKRDIETRDIPVIIASVADDRELGYALGATDYFVKPVERDALLARLDSFAFMRRARYSEIVVLVVDDEPDSANLLEAMLTPAGFTVVKAGGGAEGIELARERLPDLVLLDLMMPDVSGFDVVDAFRAEPRLQEVPILVITAKTITDEDKRRLNGRVTALLQKGAFAAVDLVEWLDRTLEQIQRGDEARR